MKALEQLDIFIHFNKNIARLTNFIFRIESAISIGSVNLDKLLKQITFYIVSINTFILLCLADIDKHKAFFNNITN